MAELDRVQLKTSNDTLFPDNTNQEITPERERQFNSDMVDSNLNISDAAPQTVVGPVSFPAGASGALISAVPLLVANDFTNQAPVGLDVTTQVTFGPAQFTPSDPIMIDADGLVTFNDALSAGNLVILAAFGRVGGGGVADMFFRSVFDFGAGDVFSEPIRVKIDNDAIQYLTFIQGLVNLPAGAEMRVEMVRDPAGSNAGGLMSDVPTAAGWPTANASATVSITAIKGQ